MLEDNLKPLCVRKEKAWSRQRLDALFWKCLWKWLLAFRLGYRFSYRRLIAWWFRRFGFPQGTQTLHVLADGEGLSFDLGHRLQSFFGRDALSIGSCDALGRGGA